MACQGLEEPAYTQLLEMHSRPGNPQLCLRLYWLLSLALSSIVAARPAIGW